MSNCKPPYQRTRGRATDVQSLYWTETYHGSKEGIVNTYGPWTGSWSGEDMTDIVTPCFKQIVESGGIVNNPCRYEKHERVADGNGSCNLTWGSFWWEGEGSVTSHQPLSTYQFDVYAPLASSDASAARAKQLALAHVDDTPYAFGEDTLEIKETLRFLRNPLKGLLTLGKDFRRQAKRARLKRLSRDRRVRGKRESARHYAMRLRKMKESSWDLTKDGRRLYDDLASLWLEYRFAASPLVRSCVDALEAYESKPEIPPDRRTARGFSTFADEASASDVPQFTGATELFYSLSQRRSEEFHASILYEVTNPVYDWRYKLGFRAKDLPYTIWQVMPYSFMVDRVWDVSSFVSGVVNLASPNVKILSGSTRVKTEFNRTWNLEYGAWTNGITGTVVGDTISDTEFVYDRKPWTPSFKDAIPSSNWRNLVDEATKVADLVTLVTQALK